MARLYNRSNDAMPKSLNRASSPLPAGRVRQYEITWHITRLYTSTGRSSKSSQSFSTTTSNKAEEAM